MSDGFLEQLINIRFCMKLEKFRRIITGDETWCFQYDSESRQQSLQWNSWHPHDPRKLVCQNHKRRQCSSLSSISLWIQPVNQAYYVEILKQLHETVRRKMPEVWSTIGFSTMELTRYSLSSSFWPKNQLLKWNTHFVLLIWLWMTSGCSHK